MFGAKDINIKGLLSFILIKFWGIKRIIVNKNKKRSILNENHPHKSMEMWRHISNSEMNKAQNYPDDEALVKERYTEFY